ncbi:ABC transporter protein [Favolaschia claudopus]|uniref:ABC transporter protein n=1 Tax=Favolaschia claudopus TaxID=2862362 RepID=A0AAW0CAT2_9AGAR
MKPDCKAPNNTHPAQSTATSPVEVIQLGVWRVFLAKGSPFFDFGARYKKWRLLYSTAAKLTMDFLVLAPIHFPLLCLATLFQRVAPVIRWHLFSRCLFMIELGVTRGQFDAIAITHAVVARIAFAATLAVITCCSQKAEFIVQTRIISHFEAISFECKPREFSASGREEDLISSPDVFYAYRDLLISVGRVLSIATQLYYVGSLASNKADAFIYGTLFLLQPFIRDFARRSLWDEQWVATSSEPHFNRMESLKSIVREPRYEQEINTNGNIKEYLVGEYKNARRALGDISSSYPPAQYGVTQRVDLSVLSAILGDIHMFYCLASAILHPSRSTLSRVIMLQKAGDLMFYELDTFVDDFHAAENGLASVKRVYDVLASNIDHRKDGNVDFSLSEPNGMELSLKNVSFSYPNCDDGLKVDDISLTIKPGQLVVIVGANGSGKSTLLKLLTRLYDCSSGNIAIDGRDIREYKLTSLQETIAVLTQDHHTFPLSLGENIGIGNPKEVRNRCLIEASARKGGAYEFIANRTDKYDTVLESTAVNYMGHLCCPEDDTALTKIFRGFVKKTEVSGGERQRVAASRTFMRLTTGKIRLVVADEPSSNLDPQGESELLQNLIDERQGKTMIFVTHRLGILTKEADLILCMKEGRLVEQGTHKELMAAKNDGTHGEYFNLYQIQAKAYVH